MKKSLIILSSTLAFVALALLLPGFVNGKAPRGEIRLLEDGNVELANTGDVSLFYQGYGKDSCLIYPQFADPGKIMPPVGLCGTGLGSHELDPGKSIIVSPYLRDEALTGDEIFWQVSVYGKTRGWRVWRYYATDRLPLLNKILPSPSRQEPTEIRSEKFIPPNSPPVAISGAPFE